MAAKRSDTGLAFLVQLERTYGTLKISACVVEPVTRNTSESTRHGELHNVSWSGSIWTDNAGREYEGFNVSAYVGTPEHLRGSDEVRGLWGITATYAPHSIERAEHARAIGAVLAKLERGHQKLNNERGWLGADDYAGHLLRAAEILGIKYFYVRNSKPMRARSGEAFRKVDGSGLQLYVSQAVTDCLNNGKVGEYV